MAGMVEGCGTAPDEQVLASGSSWCFHRGVSQGEVVFHVEATGHGGEAQGEYAGFFVGEGVRDGGYEVGAEDDVFLECAFRGLVAARVEADSMADDAVARGEALDV